SSLLLVLRRPLPPLFPYTTLFRSLPPPILKLRQPRLVAAQPLGRRVRRRRGAEDVGRECHRVHRLDEAVGRQIRARLRSGRGKRSEEHTSELQSRVDLVCRLLLEK